MSTVQFNLRSVGALVVASLAFGGQAIAANGTNPMAMTWGTDTDSSQIGGSNVTSVGCNHAGVSCNAYTGDTSENEKHRILCIVPGTAPEPVAYTNYFSAGNYSNVAVNNWKFYHNWSGAKIGLSGMIPGSSMLNASNQLTQSKADAICKSIVGLNDPNARMLEFHDNKVGGWAVGGLIHPNSKVKHELRTKNANLKYWVRIIDQPSNLWN